MECQRAGGSPRLGRLGPAEVLGGVKARRRRPRYVENRMTGRSQHRPQQRGLATDQIDGPDHLNTHVGLGEQILDRVLVVAHPHRPYDLPMLVNGRRVMSLPAGIDAYPHVRQSVLQEQPETVTTNDLADSSLTSDDSQISISGQGALSRPGGRSSMATQRQTTYSHTRPTRRSGSPPDAKKPKGTTLSPRDLSARLRLGRRWSGWPPSQKPERPAGGMFLSIVAWVLRAAGRDAGRRPPAASSERARCAALARRLDPVELDSAVPAYGAVSSVD